MSQTVYRRKAILSRVHKALDAFYMLQKIDWEYDIRITADRIMKLAMEEIEFEGGKTIERALLIIETEKGSFEAQAGYKTDDADMLDLTFSRTVVQQTIDEDAPVLCENAVDDPRFMEAESIKVLETLSLLSVPLSLGGVRPVGAMYVESKSPGHLFAEGDLEFLTEFAETVAPYIKTAMTHQDHVEAIRKLKDEVRDRYRLGNLIGKSEGIRNVFDLISIASNVDRTVLITGESGCGKELVSKAIHFNGHRKDKNFVVVDCSGLSEHLLESELFGHKKGAFTGASSDKIGAFEEADGGTLFLDEISDASKSMQQKLRRVLQESEIRRVGENELRKVDVRVICATNKNLAELVKKEEFIRDLYFRINKFPIHLPPLRERREDVPLLVYRFLELHTRPGRPSPKNISAEAMEILCSMSWSQNNVRELRNAVELAADFAQDDEIDKSLLDRILHIQQADSQPEDLSSEASRKGEGGFLWLQKDRLRELLDEHQDASVQSNRAKPDAPFYRLQLECSARLIIEGLRATQWKLRPAAKLLGISPMKLRGELKEYLRETLLDAAGDIDAASLRLAIPSEVLRRKASDLGIDDLVDSEA